MKIVIVKQSIMNFYNPKTKRQEWYFSDMLPGNNVEFKDIAFVGSDRRVMFECLDGEYASLPVDSFLIKETKYMS